jgi:hypothetical protein
MSETKTHYRKVFKSDHLGVADLEDMLEEKKRLVFTIKEVKQEINVVVAGRKGSHNIAYFKESIKPLVLNSINSKMVKSFNNGSPFVEDWANTIIELYIDSSVKMKGEVVGGVRINPKQPSLQKPQLTEGSKAYNNAVSHLKGKGTMDDIKKHYTITPEIEEKLKAAVI